MKDLSKSFVLEEIATTQPVLPKDALTETQVYSVLALSYPRYMSAAAHTWFTPKPLENLQLEANVTGGEYRMIQLPFRYVTEAEMDEAKIQHQIDFVLCKNPKAKRSHIEKTVRTDAKRLGWSSANTSGIVAGAEILVRSEPAVWAGDDIQLTQVHEAIHYLANWVKTNMGFAETVVEWLAVSALRHYRKYHGLPNRLRRRPYNIQPWRNAHNQDWLTDLLCQYQFMGRIPHKEFNRKLGYGAWEVLNDAIENNQVALATDILQNKDWTSAMNFQGQTTAQGIAEIVDKYHSGQRAAKKDSICSQKVMHPSSF